LYWGDVASEQRQIEAGLFGGTERGMAATNALELGVNVGHVDAMLHLGFPGNMYGMTPWEAWW
jgi:DEAD/DEAH box helicase domain-containing protein